MSTGRGQPLDRHGAYPAAVLDRVPALADCGAFGAWLVRAAVEAC